MTMKKRDTSTGILCLEVLALLLTTKEQKKRKTKRNNPREKETR